MNTQGHETILLDIYEKLGSVDAKLTALAKSHETMDEDVEDLKLFKSRVGAYLWLGGSIAAGAMMILWEGLKYFSSNVHDALGKLFH